MNSSMPSPAELFLHCPQCGRARESTGPVQPFHCAHCGFHFYFNAAPAVAGIMLDPAGRALFIRRAKEPARGQLALPGGFVDLGESAEAALRREIREEVNLEVGPLQYLCSHPNEYAYRGVAYPVLDSFYVTHAVRTEGIQALDGVESYCWMDPAKVKPEEIAFPSIREALKFFNVQRGR